MSDTLHVFVSHRTPDSPIADELRNTLELWGIPERCIFRSTHPSTSLESGEKIKDGLMDKLKDTDLFILIYTSPDQDWSYCMWELGVATASETKATHVVCFATTEHPPKLMSEVQINRVTHDDIKKFTYNLHRSQNFLITDEPTKEKEHALLDSLRNVSDQVIETRASQFHENLKGKVPTGEQKDLHRWDYLQLYLEPSVLASIRSLEEKDENSVETQKNLVKKHAVVLNKSQNSAIRAFGYQDFEAGITIQELKNRWVSEYKVKKSARSKEPVNANVDWARDLCADIIRAIFNKRAQRTFNYFESISIDQPTFYRPAVIKAKKLIDDAMEFDVYLYRLAADEMELINLLAERHSNPTEQ